MLALEANATVPVDRLVDGLWGDDPPATAGKMIQLYVSRLRRVFSGDDVRIVTHGRGYELRIDEDAVRFEPLIEQAGRGADVSPARAALGL
jgi:DNA-binding SARP family transcriptional activator